MVVLLRRLPSPSGVGVGAAVLRSRNHSLSLPNTLASTASVSEEGVRLPVSTMLRYDTEGAFDGSRWTQRADSSSRVKPFRFRRVRNLEPRKCPCRINPAMDAPGRVKFTM